MKRVSYEDITLTGATSRGVSAKKMSRPLECNAMECLNCWLEKMMFFPRKFIQFIYKKNKSPVQKRPCHADISRTYCLGKDSGPHVVQRRLSKLIQKLIRNGIR
jgi:hypothetical protein